MITDARVLQPEFILREVQHRDAEVNYLSSVLDPIPTVSELTHPSSAAHPGSEKCVSCNFSWNVSVRKSWISTTSTSIAGKTTPD